MKTEAKTPDEYIDSVPDSHKATIKKLRSVIKKNLSEGFEETMNYSMIGCIVPHSSYPKGYISHYF